MKNASVVLASLAVALAAAAPPASAMNRCDNPGDVGARRACAYAAQGPEELRRFVERTQSVYRLYYWDYAQTAATDIAKADATRVASNAPVAKK
jgi:hypothetical protein